jgi:nucleotide-binding universal stress UspA family protein
MFSQILVPVDGSAASNEAVDKAAAIALAFKSHVTVVSVIDVFAFASMGMDGGFGQVEYLKAMTDQAQTAVHDAKLIFDAAGIALSTSVIEGQVVYQNIMDAATSSHADLIVMGSHGRKGFEKLMLGSVAAQVLAHTHLPVMIVRQTNQE